LFNRQPLAIEAGADDEVIGVTVVETQLVAPVAIGRRNAEPIEGSESLLEADVEIIAFGFSPPLPAWLAPQGVEAASDGRLVAGGAARRAYETHKSGLDAVGDAVVAAALVVTAVAGGRDAAARIITLQQRCHRADTAKSPVGEVTAMRISLAANRLHHEGP